MFSDLIKAMFSPAVILGRNQLEICEFGFMWKLMER